MSINAQNLVMPLHGLSPIKLDLDGGGDASLERQRLQLAQEQFENVKWQQRKQLELQQMEEGGRMARERMVSDRIQQQQQAEAAAKVKEQQNAALANFTKMNGEGDIEGARAMVPLMSQLGMQVDLLGEQNGLPAYRIGPDPEAAQRDQGAFGYPSTDSSPMQAPMGIPSTQDAFQQALASQGHPAKPPDQPDYTGAVPKNVLDMGAIQQQSAARLNPALSGLVQAYPEAYRASAQQTADAVRGLGLPASKTVEMFDKQRGAPDSLIRADIAAEAQAGQNTAKMGETQGKDAHQRYKTGFNIIGKEAGSKFGVEGIIERRKTRAQANNALTNENDADDYLAGSSVARDMGEKGVLTEGDIKRTLGSDAMSLFEKLESGSYKWVGGGLSPQQKDSLLGLIKYAEEQDTKRAHEFLANTDEVANDPGTDKDTARGIKDYRKIAVPRDIRDEYEQSKKGGSARAPSAPSTPGPFNMEEDSKREYGADGGTQIPKTSRIAFEHNNPGNLKFVGQPGATKGEAADDGGSWAKFASVDDGLTALRAQVEHDAEAGMSVRDFISKYAPPGSNDTETYIKQATAALKAKEGDSLAEVDPYDVVRFIAKKESGTELPDQYAKKDAKAAGGAAQGNPTIDEMMRRYQ
jgi:hypothetical protein